MASAARVDQSRHTFQDVVRTLKVKGASLKATKQPIDTSRRDMLGVFAAFETNLRRERWLEGIVKTKAEGVYKGRRCVGRRGETARDEGARRAAGRYHQRSRHWPGEHLAGVRGAWRTGSITEWWSRPADRRRGQQAGTGTRPALCGDVP
jgi:DNA invertase Pin-like site-specific DNA recombinase